MKPDEPNAPANPENATGGQTAPAAPLETLFPEPKASTPAAPAFEPVADASAPFGRKKDGTPKKAPGGRPARAKKMLEKVKSAIETFPGNSPTPPPEETAKAGPEPAGASDALPTDEPTVLPANAPGDGPVVGSDKLEKTAKRLAKAFTLILYGICGFVFGPEFNEPDEKQKRADLEESARVYFLERPDLSLTPGLAFGLECLAWTTDKMRLPVVRARIIQLWNWARKKPSAPALTS